MRLIIAFIFIIWSSSSLANSFINPSTPQWVHPINSLDTSVSSGSSSYQYLLFDFQDNLAEQTIYRHYAIKLLNSEGVQSFSDISVHYDPTYQHLKFHKVRIIRNGKTINKLNENKINIYQRETSMERSLYDGSLTAVINLTDVRAQDIIEYTYSIKGFNPIWQGHYSNTFFHQLSIPINRIYNRVITNKSKDIQYKSFHGAKDPSLKQSGNLKQYIWDIDGKNFKLYDVNVPSWYDPHKRISFTTYPDWAEVAKQVYPHYQYKKSEEAVLDKHIYQGSNKKHQIVKLIRFVQDEIRYLGFESGISGYKPNPPKQVYQQRYGDCKDKSLLLVSLLRNIDVEAYPMLVNSNLKHELENTPPSIGSFNHCVVKLRFEGKDYYIDPTLSNQGGSLENIHFPSYKKGLLIHKNVSELLDLPEPEKPSLQVKELITMDSIEGSAELVVRSEYKGSNADHIRDYFNSGNREQITKEYEDFYSNIYPKIKSSKQINFLDQSRWSSNKIIIEEYYTIENFWKQSDDESYIYCETYPLILETDIYKENSSDQKMPYYMGLPFIYSQQTQVVLPENWPVDDYHKVIDGSGFYYENDIKSIGNTVFVDHIYDLDAEYIPGDSVESMLLKHEAIQNELSYYITYQRNTDFKFSWISALFITITLTGGIFLAIKLHKYYDPDPYSGAENKTIGGWLILPAIGIVLSPFIMLVDFLSLEIFDQNTIKNFSYLGDSVSIYAFLIIETVYNVFFLIFAVLVLIQFYQRRSSLPKLIIIFYIIAFLGPLIDLLVAEVLIKDAMGEVIVEEDIRSISKSFVVCVIWIPYFLVSERVKNTFCKTYNKKNIEEVSTATY